MYLSSRKALPFRAGLPGLTHFQQEDGPINLSTAIPVADAPG
jgi:hypothetical protein